MDRVTKKALKDAIARRLGTLSEGEGMSTKDLIVSTPEIITILALKGSLPESREAIDYIRRMIHEVISQRNTYGLENIRSVLARHVIRGYKTKTKKEWIWVNTSNVEEIRQAVIRDYWMRAGKLVQNGNRIASILKIDRPPHEVATELEAAEQSKPEQKRTYKVVKLQQQNDGSTETVEEGGDDHDGDDTAVEPSSTNNDDSPPTTS